MRPVRRRSPAPTATASSPASAPAATATCSPLEGAPQLASVVKSVARPGDYVVCLGAGNITQWAYALPGELDALGAAG